jgi:putative nucleotidyltransferase with HDIG domain
LPDTDKQGCITFAERLLGNTECAVFDLEGKRVRMKISIGAAAFPEDGQEAMTVSGLLAIADKALAKAKEGGGNRICTFDRLIAVASEKEPSTEDLNNLKKKLAATEKRATQTLLETIYGFAKAIEARDFYTGDHAEHMIALVSEVGRSFGLPEQDIENLRHAAVLHDLGKIGIPDYILHKTTKLTDEEYKAIKRHPLIGAEIIRQIHFLKDLVPIIAHHHEWYNGSGYPDGLKGGEIPLGARIVAVVDVYHALTSNRPYRAAYDKEEALSIIKNGSGTQFDPAIVKAFISVIKQMEKK